jgi:SAM-dependent methyltransferase
MTRALDVGCGCGDNMGWTAGFDVVVGIDLDREQLKAAQRRHPGGIFLQVSGESMPFPDGCFDAIHAHVSVPYMNVPAAVREFRRVLRPGGQVFLSLHSFWLVLAFWWENVRGGNWRGALFYHPYIIFNGILLQLGCKPIRFPLNRHRMESFQTRSGMQRLLTRNEFDEIQFEGRGHRLQVTAKRLG